MKCSNALDFPWKLRLICCSRDGGEEVFSTWEAADAFRNAYTGGPGVDLGGHYRVAILERNDGLLGEV